jgi:trans-2-enoyl-CoA reductase
LYSLLKETIESPKVDQVQLGFICSPVNPSDLNQIQGVYPKRPEFTPEFGAIGGNEGVAKVIEVGKNLQDKFEVGDWVIPNKSCLGTWRKFGNFDANEIHKVPKIEGVKAEMVGMLGVNPCTAYRMLKDFADLKKGNNVANVI